MIEVERDGSVALLRIARGKVNAFDVETLEHLVVRLDEIQASDARAVVFTGRGTVFSAGVDLVQVLDGGAEYVGRLQSAWDVALERFFRFPKPVVGAINGPAIAGGCIFASACDIRIATDSARMGATEIAIGVPLLTSALEVLRHACGYHGESIVLTGRVFEPAEAVAVGLVHEVVPSGDLIEHAIMVATRLGSSPSEIYASAKLRFRAGTLERIAENIASGAESTHAENWSPESTSAALRGEWKDGPNGR